jgi:hypothetical protein
MSKEEYYASVKKEVESLLCELDWNFENIQTKQIFNFYKKKYELIQSLLNELCCIDEEYAIFLVNKYATKYGCTFNINGKEVGYRSEPVSNLITGDYL